MQLWRGVLLHWLAGKKNLHRSNSNYSSYWNMKDFHFIVTPRHNSHLATSSNTPLRLVKCLLSQIFSGKEVKCLLNVYVYAKKRASSSNINGISFFAFPAQRHKESGYHHLSLCSGCGYSLCERNIFFSSVLINFFLPFHLCVTLLKYVNNTLKLC